MRSILLVATCLSFLACGAAGRDSSEDQVSKFLTEQEEKRQAEETELRKMRADAEKKQEDETAAKERAAAAEKAERDKPPPPPEPAATRCPKTRAARVKDAKEGILAVRAKVKELDRYIRWAKAHKCQVKDTTGSVLVSKKREAAGLRVAVKHGHANDIVCNVADVPPEVDETVMNFAELEPDDLIMTTDDECDELEKPSLAVTWKDKKGQDAILALP